MRPRAPLGILVASSQMGVVFACGGATVGDEGAVDSGAPAPKPTPTATSAPTSTTAPMMDATLPKDAGRTSGVCPGGGVGVCSSDDDCPAGIPCGCDVPYCLSQSNCRTNGDCASGETCSLSVPFFYRAFPDGGGIDYLPHDPDEKGGFYHTELYGYFCTTPNDTCEPGTRNEMWSCDYQTDHWAFGTSL